MNMHRKGESGHIPFRSGRFFYVNDQWFYATREGQDIGPFESQEEAKADLSFFLRKMALAQQEISAG